MRGNQRVAQQLKLAGPLHSPCVPLAPYMHAHRLAAALPTHLHELLHGMAAALQRGCRVVGGSKGGQQARHRLCRGWREGGAAIYAQVPSEQQQYRASFQIKMRQRHSPACVSMGASEGRSPRATFTTPAWQNQAAEPVNPRLGTVCR